MIEGVLVFIDVVFFVGVIPVVVYVARGIILFVGVIAAVVYVAMVIFGLLLC